MTKEQAIDELNSITDSGDTEIDHGIADDTLLRFLDTIGHEDVAEAYRQARERAGFWYA